MDVKDKIIGFLGLKPKSDFVNQYISKSNLSNGRWASAAVVILEIWMFAHICGRHAPGDRFSMWFLGHLAAFATLFAASLIFFIYALVHIPEGKKLNDRTISVMVIIYTLLCAAFGIYISVTDPHNPYMTFLTMQICCLGLFMLLPAYTILYGVISFVVYAQLLEKFSSVVRGPNVNLIIMEIVVVMVCILQYRKSVALAKSTEETEQLNEQLKAISFYDSLMGIRNRRALGNDIPNYFDRALYVMMIDVDDLKYYNDTFGHQCGDLLLRHLGETLREVFSREFCYRYGGDEVLVIVPDETKDSFIRALDSWTRAFSRFNINGKDFSPTFSYGYVTGAPDSEASMLDLINRADMNLVTMKSGKKKRSNYQRDRR